MVLGGPLANANPTQHHPKFLLACGTTYYMYKVSLLDTGLPVLATFVRCYREPGNQYLFLPY